MDLLITRPDPAVTSALEAAGHRISVWDPSSPAPDAHLAIVHGLAEVARAATQPVHLLAIVEATEVEGAVARGARLADFVVGGVSPGELTARVARICARPSWPRERLNALMVLAV